MPAPVHGGAQRARGRSGYLRVPRAWFEAVERGDLTVEQLAIAILIAGEANYREPTVASGQDGRRYAVGVRETLVGRRRFAERYRMGKGGRDRVTRAIARGQALGMWNAGPAPAAPSPAPRSAPGSTPPPTLISFCEHADVLFPASEAAPPLAPPSDPPSAPPPDPIQEGEEGKEGNEGLFAPASPLAARVEDPEPPDFTLTPPPGPPAQVVILKTAASKKAKAEKGLPDRRHALTMSLARTALSELIGPAAVLDYPKDGTQLRRFLAGNPTVTPEQIDAAWRAALRDARGPRAFAALLTPTFWNRYCNGEAAPRVRRAIAGTGKWTEADKDF